MVRRVRYVGTQIKHGLVGEIFLGSLFHSTAISRIWEIRRRREKEKEKREERREKTRRSCWGVEGWAGVLGAQQWTKDGTRWATMGAYNMLVWWCAGRL